MVSCNTKLKDQETIKNNIKLHVNLEIYFWYKQKFSFHVIILILQRKVMYMIVDRLSEIRSFVSTNENL